MELHAGPSEASTIIHWMDIEHADLLSSDGKEGRRTDGRTDESDGAAVLAEQSRAFFMHSSSKSRLASLAGRLRSRLEKYLERNVGFSLTLPIPHAVIAARYESNHVSLVSALPICVRAK